VAINFTHAYYERLFQSTLKPHNTLGTQGYPLIQPSVSCNKTRSSSPDIGPIRENLYVRVSSDASKIDTILQLPAELCNLIYFHVLVNPKTVIRPPAESYEDLHDEAVVAYEQWDSRNRV